MKKLRLLILAILVLLGPLTFSQEILKANYYTAPRMSKTVATNLAINDLVIVDIDNLNNNRENLELLKKLNPNIVLLIYTNILEVFPNPGINRPWQEAMVKELISQHPTWLLKTDKGNNAVFTSGMIMVNASSTCPKINGQTYADWMADKLTPVLRDSLIDGYYCDNGSGNWSFIYTSSEEKIDVDNDGKPDQDYILDHNLSEGIHDYLTKIRQAMGKKFILLANKGSVEYMDVLNGRMFEGWTNNYLGDTSDGGWWQCLLNGWKTGDYTIIQVKSTEDWEFACLSAKLLGHKVYVAVGQDNSEPYPEFPGGINNLGKINKIEIKAYFENGSISIDPTKKTAKILKKEP